MADPFRLRLLIAVTNAIKSVTPDNGYVADLSDFLDDATGKPMRRVFRGRDTFGDGDPLPMVSILEDPRTLDATNADEGYGATVGDYRLLIQGFVEDDRENPTDPAHRLVAEVIAALAKQKAEKYDILGLGEKMPCVVGMEIGQPIVRPADDVLSSVSNFYLPLRLTLAEDLEDPFA